MKNLTKLSHLLNQDDKYPTAILALANGEIFEGRAVGAPGCVVAELVFNTSMTGYQEILTDASYCQQIVLLTYPHIGNYGTNGEDIESARVQASGLVIRNLPIEPSNFRNQQSLPDYLKANNIVAIAGVDTRKITRILRENGVMGACILVGGTREQALEKARNYQGMVGQNLVDQVTSDHNVDWTQKTWKLEAGGYTDNQDFKHHVVAFDFGVKSNILRLLADRECKVTLVPSNTPVEEVLKLNPDGVFFSNGPGDPAPLGYAIKTVQTVLERKIPCFGICLGHQLMGLAVGAKTVKMKTGHHGANHPVKDLATGHVFITSQNHGFAVDANTLPANSRVTHVSLFDGTLQGFEMTDRPAFCFQGHPEAGPGPHDITVLFDKFVKLMEQNH